MEITTQRCSLSGLKQHGEEWFKSFPPYFIIEFYALSEQKYKEASIMWIKTIDEDYEYNAMYLNAEVLGDG